jgi:DNA-binding Xre family transcriptional regulator
MHAPTRTRHANIDLAASQMFAHFLQAYLECEPEIQDVIRRMAAIIDDPEADEDDRAMAIATLYEALFPTRSRRDGLLGVDLEREERRSAREDEANRATFDAEEEAFAGRVQSILRDRNMTQEQLAEALEIGQPAVSMLLSRKSRPQRRTVERFARVLGVVAEDLWPGFKGDVATE